jgi:hypothetical protein
MHPLAFAHPMLLHYEDEARWIEVHANAKSVLSERRHVD